MAAPPPPPPPPPPEEVSPTEISSILESYEDYEPPRPSCVDDENADCTPTEDDGYHEDDEGKEDDEDHEDDVCKPKETIIVPMRYVAKPVPSDLPTAVPTADPTHTPPTKRQKIYGHPAPMKTTIRRRRAG